MELCVELCSKKDPTKARFVVILKSVFLYSIYFYIYEWKIEIKNWKNLKKWEEWIAKKKDTTTSQCYFVNKNIFQRGRLGWLCWLSHLLVGASSKAPFYFNYFFVAVIFHFFNVFFFFIACSILCFVFAYF